MRTREIDEGRDLPADLELPLASGKPWWYWLGGRPAVDFVNTRRERWNRDVETLVSDSDLSAWLIASGLLETPLPIKRGVLSEARALREAIDGALTAAIDGRAPAKADVHAIDLWLAHSGERPQLALAGGELSLGERAAADSPRRALGTIALDAARMFALPEQRERLRVCASETCSARFYDRSPAGRRRWCSMRACGNVAKARRHRAKARA